MSTLTFFGARIDLAEVHNGKTFTVVTMPAPDSFSHPARYKLTSNGQIGNIGSVMDIQVQLSGVVRQKNYRDRDTGQPRQFQEADVYFNVITAVPHNQNADKKTA